LYEYQNIRSYYLVKSARCFFPYQSTPRINRCIPDFDLNVSSIVVDQINSFNSTTTMLINAAFDTWYIIAGGIVASIIFGFFWLLLMRYFAGVAIWANVISSFLSVAAVAFMMFYTGKQLEMAYENTPNNLRILADVNNYQFLTVMSYILFGIAAIMLLFTIFNSGNIHLAIIISQEASKAFISMPSLLFFPLIPLVKFLIVFAYFVIVGLYLASSVVNNGAYDEDGQFLGYIADTKLKAMILVLLFGFLWSVNVIIAISQTVIAGAIADWYYSYRGRKLKPCAVTRSYGRMINNLGSLIIGSLIIAIIQFIRIMFKYLKQNLKGKDGKVTEAIYQCLQCCLACFERFIEYLNKNAYIMIAIYGYSFCVSAKRAFAIIITNPLKAATIQCISSYCMLLGKISISSLATGGVFIFLKNTTVTSLWIVPVLVTAVGSFCVASLFMNVYDMAISSMLLCFLEDTNVNDGSSERPYHCSKSLIALVEKSGFKECCVCC